MTILCAFTTNEGTLIGSDSLRSGDSLKFTGDFKWIYGVHHHASVAVGFAGSARAATVVSQNREVIVDDPYATADNLRDLLQHDQWKPVSEDGESPAFGVQVIWADGSRCYMIFNDGSVHEVPNGELAAMGSGMLASLGSWEAVVRLVSLGYVKKKLDGVDLIKIAIKSAMEVDPHCGGEIRVDLIPRNPLDSPKTMYEEVRKRS